MREIFYDSETVPSTNAAVRAQVSAEIKPPGNMKKKETIEKWEQEEKPALIDEAMLKTSFDGAYGQIVVISYAIDDDKPKTIWNDRWENGVGESTILEEFFDDVDAMFASVKSNFTKMKWIGHRIADFDLRFLFQRAVVLGIKPPIHIPFHVKPWDESIVDTQSLWCGFKNSVKLSKLCDVLQVPGKGTEIGEEIDGSMVYDFVKQGRMREVATYCAGDVERVRAVYRRMTFSNAVPVTPKISIEKAKAGGLFDDSIDA